MFRCKNNVGLCVLCIGIGIMLSALLTKFALFFGIVVCIIGIWLLFKGGSF